MIDTNELRGIMFYDNSIFSGTKMSNNNIQLKL